MDHLYTDLVAIGATCAVVSLIVVIVLAVFLGVHCRRVERIFVNIYKESEDRIGRANTMVNQCTESLKVQAMTEQKMADMYNEITKEYISEIRSIKDQRDKLTDENKELARTTHELASILSHKKDQTINIEAPKNG